MIPRTDVCVPTAHVPYPILANTPYMNTTMHEPRVSFPSNVHPNPVPSRRGRRSTIPPDIREQTRRLKKQNMERRRRACISDKMNALHNLALSLVGVDPQESPKVEKADILSICHSVFEGIAKIAKDDPELKFRLHKLRNCLREPSTSSTSQPSIHHLMDETTRSSTLSESSCSRTSSPLLHPAALTRQYSIDHSNKENYVPHGLPANNMSSNPENVAQLRSADQWHSTPVLTKHMYGQQSSSHSDSGFHSFQDPTKTMDSLMQSSYKLSPPSCSSMTASPLLNQIPRPNQDHVFPKPSLTKYQMGFQNRSAFTPIRQAKMFPVSLPISSPPLKPSSQLVVSSSSSTVQTGTTSTKTAMWRPYLD